MLTAHTRKVRTYGKSKTRIVNDPKFDLVVSPTKYHSPIKNRNGAVRDVARVGDSDYDHDNSADDDGDVEQDTPVRQPLQPTTRNRAPPLSQVNLNQRASNSSKDVKVGKKPAPKGLISLKPAPRAKSREDAPPPSAFITRTRPRSVVVSTTTRGIRAEAPVSSSSTGSFISAVSTVSSVSSGSVFSLAKADLDVDSGAEDEEDTAEVQVPRRSTRNRTRRQLPDAAPDLNLELDLDLGSLRISSGRFDDAPSIRSGMGMGMGMNMEMETEMEASGSSTVRPVGIGEGSVIVLDEDDDESIKKDEGDEEDEEEAIIPVLKRRTRKTQPRVPRSSSSSAEVVTEVAKRGRGRTESQVAATRTRGRKVVHSPESSERTNPTREVIKIKEDDEEDDLIVVLPPNSRDVTPRLSASAEEVPQDPVQAVTDTLNSLDLAPSSISDETPLRALLDLCAQPSTFDFSQFLSDHTFGPEEKETGENGFRKVGEASYSEVYALLFNAGPSQDAPKVKGKARGGRKKQVTAASSSSGSRETGLVLKVIPLTEEATPVAPKDDTEDEEEDDGVACSLVTDVKREIEITRLMSEMGDGFVRCHGAYVVRGQYPEVLLDAWDEFEDQRGSDSVRPGELPESQLYALIVLENAGVDLESFVFDKNTGWKQAWGAVMQVTMTLAEGEVKARFEHRDLHEGQVLLRPVESVSTEHPSDASHPSFIGFKATLVDFGLSRVDHPHLTDRPYYTPIPEDVFSGEGDQWDVYRSIRDLVEDESGSDWAEHLPRTNLMWLRHLVRVLLHSTKSLKKPRIKPTARKSAVSVESTENERYYGLLVDFESTLRQALEGPSTKPRTRTRQKRTITASMDVPQLGTMTEFVDLMKVKGWVR